MFVMKGTVKRIFQPQPGGPVDVTLNGTPLGELTLSFNAPQGTPDFAEGDTVEVIVTKELVESEAPPALGPDEVTDADLSGARLDDGTLILEANDAGLDDDDDKEQS